jgi:alanine racemase
VSVRPTVASVDLRALAHNYRQLAGYVSASEGPAATNRTGIIAVVKANAYGHGAARVGLALEAAGAPWLACADIEEGVLLRQAGVRIPILVFGALSLGNIDGVFDSRLTPTVSTPAAVRTLEEGAARRGVRLACHLKIDTGMNRLGFRHDQLDRTMPPLLGSPHLHVTAVYTHFATADNPDDPLFGEQRERFDRAYAKLKTLGLGPVARHAANSAALMRDERVWFDFIRPGLLLYGLVPPPLGTTMALKPVMQLKSRIVAVKGIRPGEGVGYGMKFRTEEPRSVAVVPAGYADGLDARLAGRGFVLVRGVRAPIVGSVCMDMLMIDVTNLRVDPGDEVVILGEQGDERMDAREMAAAIGTIPYELLCRIGTRIERVYVD